MKKIASVMINLAVPVMALTVVGQTAALGSSSINLEVTEACRTKSATLKNRAQVTQAEKLALETICRYYQIVETRSHKALHGIAISNSERDAARRTLKNILHPEATLSAPIFPKPIQGAKFVDFFLNQLLPAVNEFYIRGEKGTPDIVVDGNWVAVTVRGSFAKKETTEVGELIHFDENGKILSVSLFTDPAKSPGPGIGYASKTHLVATAKANSTKPWKFIQNYYGGFLNPRGERNADSIAEDLEFSAPLAPQVFDKQTFLVLAEKLLLRTVESWHVEQVLFDGSQISVRSLVYTFHHKKLPSGDLELYRVTTPHLEFLTLEQGKLRVLRNHSDPSGIKPFIPKLPTPGKQD